ncbi:MAG: DUF4145 domain-containing protein [Thiobacillus sp.]|nr:DUF4145 domain-containing protein [Thiobacillus sp.]
MSSEKTIWTDCRSCGRSTRHEILFQHEKESDPAFWHEKDTWQVVRCLGCTTVGFRHRNDDYENVWQDDDGEVHHDVEISLFPRVIRNHKKLALYQLPSLIRLVYEQTLSAYSEKAYVLAGIGLRATIEAVCNQLNLSGSSLEKRIDQLYKGGHVSNGDKKRLHAIRFLGNDAAHEIKEPKESELRVALEIIEHLLNSVFILERKAKSLETVIETYEEFLPVVATCTKAFEGDQAISLSTLLGRRRRLIGQNLDAFEDKLRSDIATGNVPYLILAQEQKVGGRNVQLYSIGDTSSIKVEAEDLLF